MKDTAIAFGNVSFMLNAISNSKTACKFHPLSERATPPSSVCKRKRSALPREPHRCRRVDIIFCDKGFCYVRSSGSSAAENRAVPQDRICKLSRKQRRIYCDLITRTLPLRTPQSGGAKIYFTLLYRIISVRSCMLWLHWLCIRDDRHPRRAAATFPLSIRGDDNIVQYPGRRDDRRSRDSGLRYHRDNRPGFIARLAGMSDTG